MNSTSDLQAVLEYFKEEEKKHNVPFDYELVEDLVWRHPYYKVSKGVNYPDAHCNRILRDAVEKMNIPTHYVHQVIDHAYMLHCRDEGYHYSDDCVISCYYNPKKKQAALDLLEKKFKSIFREAELLAGEEIEVYPEGLYNCDKTFAIFIPGSVLHAYLKTKIDYIGLQIYTKIPQSQLKKLPKKFAETLREIDRYLK